MELLSAKTNEKIESLHNTLSAEIAGVRSELQTHSNRLDSVENDLKASKQDSNCEKINQLAFQIEQLKQDRLRNNLRITGLPQNAYNDPDEAILRIAALLNIDIIPSDYTVYVDRHKSSIIVSFSSHALKRHTMDAMRKKKSLFVEEVYESTQSNSQIYANDQLTPYFAKLFQLAWRAKKDGTLHSVSSLGGRIRVKKSENSESHIIETETELNTIIACTEPMETESNGKEKSRNSQTSSITPNKTKSPTSIDSATSRRIRTRPFSHQRQQHHQPNPFSNRISQQSTSNSTRYQHQQQQQREQFTKRSNRHVYSLENRSQQPQNKKSRHGNPTNSNALPDHDSGEFSDYRRQYRNQLRSYTK